MTSGAFRKPDWSLGYAKRLLSPTLFIATQDELDVISVCNLSGEVVQTLGTRKRTVLAASLAEFLTQLKPVL